MSRPFQAQGCVPSSVAAVFRLAALLRLVAVLHLAAPLRRGAAFLLAVVLHLANGQVHALRMLEEVYQLPQPLQPGQRPPPNSLV